jgi:hypothetical protein
MARKSSSLLSQAYLSVFLVGLVHIFSVVSPAQSTFGEFVGTARDPSGAAIPGCKVTVKNLATSASRTALTDSGGFYTVVNLDRDSYEIVLEALGFQATSTFKVGIRGRFRNSQHRLLSSEEAEELTSKCKEL